MWTSVTRTQPELLAFADGDVGAVLPGRREQRQADGVDAGDRERAGGVSTSGQRRRILEKTEEVRLLEDDGRGLGSGFHASAHLEVAAFTEAAEHLDVLRVDVARDQYLVATGVDIGHHRRLGDCRRSVIKRGVGDVECGQLGDQGLKLEDRLQRALARLGLVGRVGGVELGL